MPQPSELLEQARGFSNLGFRFWGLGFNVFGLGICKADIIWVRQGFWGFGVYICRAFFGLEVLGFRV